MYYSLHETVFKGLSFQTDRKLNTKVYFKPTDMHQLLHGSSSHPKLTFKGIVNSQIENVTGSVITSRILMRPGLFYSVI